MGKTASLAGVFLLVATLIAVVGASSQFTVGDDQGWRQPDANDTGMYTRWASKIRFQIGDSIYFQYTNDSVLLVDKKDYYHCNTTNPIADFKDGKTVVKLDRSGQFYFISGLLITAKGTEAGRRSSHFTHTALACTTTGALDGLTSSISHAKFSHFVCDSLSVHHLPGYLMWGTL